MPERQTILTRIDLLPIVEPPLITGLMDTDNRIWEGDEDGAHFNLTKEQLPYPQLPPMYTLSVWGNRAGIEKIIEDFKNVLGEPLIRTLKGRDFVSWNALEVDRKRDLG